MSGEREGKNAVSTTLNQGSAGDMSSNGDGGAMGAQHSTQEPVRQASSAQVVSNAPSSKANSNSGTTLPLPTHSTPLPRYSGPAVARDKLHYVSTLRFPRIPVPQPIDRILRVLLHILQAILLPGSQHSFYWAEITSPQAGDCYAIQRQAINRPSDGCDWLMDAQILTGVFSEWPLEVAIYTRGGAERQRNPATALARLEYRVSSSNPPTATVHAIPGLVSNLVFVQFVPLVSLKGFQPMATSQPPLIPVDFAKAMAGFAARATVGLPHHGHGALRPPMSSSASAASAQPSSKATSSLMSAAQNAPVMAESKAGLSITKGIPSKRGVAASAAPVAYNAPLFVEEPIESMGLAPIDATGAVEKALLRMQARPAPLTRAILASSSSEPASEQGQVLELTASINEQIRELRKDIQQMTEAGAQEYDRRQQLRRLLNEDDARDNKSLSQLIAAVQPLTNMRITRSG